MYTLFWLSHICIWFMLLLNMTLLLGGFRYVKKVNQQKPSVSERVYPMVSVLVPAHNEALVIRNTVISLLNFDYPQDKYEIIVVNDNSSDNSAQILRELQETYAGRKLIVLNTDSQIGGKGKSNALNLALPHASGSVLAIYDADNTPESGALRILVEHLMEDENLAAVVGTFRTRNKTASLLTRFINLETLSQQYINQAGRSHFLKLCTIPGTNYVIRREIIDRLNGWDVNALTEDVEVSFRIYRMGYRIKLVPSAVTWEQEPQKMKQWFRQRTRWALGNIQVFLKNFKYGFDPAVGPIRFDIIYYFLSYTLVLFCIVFSDVFLLLQLLKITALHTGIPLLLVNPFILFVLTLFLSLLHVKKEFTPANCMLTVLMLVSYSKLWVLVTFRAVFLYCKNLLRKTQTKWDKTERFEEPVSPRK